jgi:hypothetical protein
MTSASRVSRGGSPQRTVRILRSIGLYVCFELVTSVCAEEHAAHVCREHEHVDEVRILESLWWPVRHA